jgi:hypothetical protein
MREDDELTQRCRARVGDILGEGIRLEALVGVGGMAAVYAATDPSGTMCAVKILHPEIAAMPEARQRFLREAAIASTLGCPGTVDVRALGEGDDEAFLVMEFLFGDTVSARAEKHGGTLPPEDVLWIADETLAVLELAHGKSVIHRDIKPENLFVTQKGVLKVLDFGIARLRETEAARSLAMTRTGMAMGTPAFMAPEQALGRWADVDGRTDLWAVGATMFTLLTGKFVHPGETLNEVMVHAATSPARSLARVLPQAPVGLVHLVDRALAYDRQERFATAASMRESVRAARDGAREPPVNEPKKAGLGDAPSTRAAPHRARLRRDAAARARAGACAEGQPAAAVEGSRSARDDRRAAVHAADGAHRVDPPCGADGGEPPRDRAARAGASLGARRPRHAFSWPGSARRRGLPRLRAHRAAHHGSGRDRRAARAVHRARAQLRRRGAVRRGARRDRASTRAGVVRRERSARRRRRGHRLAGQPLFVPRRG